MMPYYINVPQGRTVRITQASLLCNVLGAFTNNFSTCHIVVLIGENGISVTHADFKVRTADIQHEIEWAGENCEKIIIYQKEGQSLFLKEHSPRELVEDSHNFIFHIWTAEQLGKEKGWTRIPVDSNINPLLIHLKANSSVNFHKHITPLEKGKEPESLLRHPDEKQFVSAHKIEEILFFNTLCPFRKQALIFNGENWLPIPQEELRARHPEPEYVDKYLSAVISNRRLMNIASMLFSARSNIIRNNTSIKMRIIDESIECAISAAKYFQDYDTKDTPADILLNDISEILKDSCDPASKFKPTSEVDRTFIFNLKSLLTKNDFNRVENLISKYMEEAPQSTFKTFILDNYKLCKSNYSERMQFCFSTQLYDKTKRIIEDMGRQVVTLCSSKQYEKAYRLLKNMLERAWCYLESDPALITIYGNIGTCLLHLQLHTEAIPYLKQTVQLRKIYNTLLESLPKYEQRLKECIAKSSGETKILKENELTKKSDAFIASENITDSSVFLNQFKPQHLGPMSNDFSDTCNRRVQVTERKGL